VDPSSTWGYFWVAASLGNIAMVSSVEKQLDLADEIRDAIEESIARDPQNRLAYHIYGVWHRKLAELGQWADASLPACFTAARHPAAVWKNPSST
jgi:hypothetical protein